MKEFLCIFLVILGLIMLFAGNLAGFVMIGFAVVIAALNDSDKPRPRY